ncbi:hypothetical protein J0L31_12005 [Terrisporobacter glycolicus]|nr:hypothetical protein [Terrisporobacter glycolicus]
MKHYYFNGTVDKNGRHEVHAEDCSYLPSPTNRIYIGYFSNCDEAIQRAQITYPLNSFDGCYWCSRPCHRG